MLKILKRTIKDERLSEIKTPEISSWHYAINPNEEEKDIIMEKFGITPDDVEDMLDVHERPWLDKENNGINIVIRIPYVKREGDQDVYTTIPLGIVITETDILTMCTAEPKILKDLSSGVVAGLYTTKRTRMLLQLFARTNIYYMRFLRDMEKIIEKKESNIRKLKNDDIIYLVEAGKSLLSFQTSVTQNGNILDKILGGKILKLYEEDEDILEDIVIDNKQTIEMTIIFSKNITSIREAYSSILNNNLNKVMKFLAAMTVILTIPTIIGSIYGMNIELPFQGSPFIFSYILATSCVIAFIVLIVFYKKEWL